MICGGFAGAARAVARPGPLRPSSSAPRTARPAPRARSAGAPDAARPRRRRRRTPRRRTPAGSPAAADRSASGIADLEDRPGRHDGAARTALDPVRLSGLPLPEACRSPGPAPARTENRTPAGLQELQRELRARRPAGRSPGRAPSTRTYSRSRVEPELDERQTAAGWRSVWCIAPATSRTSSVAGAQPLEVARLLAVDASAPAAPVGVGLRPAARAPSRCC